MRLLRHLLAIGLLPFVVAVVVPAYLIRAKSGPNVAWNLASPLHMFSALVGGAFVVLGVLLVYETVALFATVGNGTLAPWDPPRRFVVRGPYRHVRNPMISGVLSVLLGEAIIFGSVPLMWWFAAFFATNALVIPFVEEPQLERRFGSEYVAYKRNVPRWIPKLRSPGDGPTDRP